MASNSSLFPDSGAGFLPAPCEGEGPGERVATVACLADVTLSPALSLEGRGGARGTRLSEETDVTTGFEHECRNAAHRTYGTGLLPSPSRGEGPGERVATVACLADVTLSPALSLEGRGGTTGMARWLLQSFVMLLLLLGTAHAQPPAGRFTDAQCIACHGADSAEVHGWRLSKHGVLTRISAPGRAPGCVACHTAEAHQPPDPTRMDQTCGHCHSPRYVATLRENGARMIEVGNMKQREALALITRARGEFPPAALADMEAHYVRLQKHLRNLRLGVAHQSPDYQWWHGHPALDGDLLRLKGTYDELVRRRAGQGARTSQSRN